MIQNIKIDGNVIVIVGPTSVGKTKTAINIAKYYDCDIISTDAYQIYKGMDIGTAKASIDEMDGVRHHFIDIVDYDEIYNVVDFQKQARVVIDDALSRGKKIVIAGGSNLFVNALLFDYNFEIDDEYKSVKNEYEKMDLDTLKLLVPQKDFNNSDYNNKRRLEAYLTKKKLGHSFLKNGDEIVYDNMTVIGLSADREILYSNINKRVDLMFKSGLIDEVKLFKRDFLSQQAIGYKEVHMYLDGEIDMLKCKQLVKKKTRNFAKRQYTWYNNKMDVTWYVMKDGVWQLQMS